MKQIFHEVTIKTSGSGLYDFTEQTKDFVNKNKLLNGILNLNVLHTSASLTIQENADPDVLYDLNNFFKKLVPMDNKLYKHTTEGKDDMPAHIRTALTNTNLAISVQNFELLLGVWQGLYVFEHRDSVQERTVFCHILGDLR